MTIFTVHYRYDARDDARERVRPEHRRFLAGLLEDGILLASGPFTGPTVGSDGTEPDGALLLVRGDSAEAATTALDADPFAREGLIESRTLRPWNPVMGPWA